MNRSGEPTPTMKHTQVSQRGRDSVSGELSRLMVMSGFARARAAQ